MYMAHRELDRVRGGGVGICQTVSGRSENLKWTTDVKVRPHGLCVIGLEITRHGGANREPCHGKILRDKPFISER